MASRCDHGLAGICRIKNSEDKGVTVIKRKKADKKNEQRELGCGLRFDQFALFLSVFIACITVTPFGCSVWLEVAEEGIEGLGQGGVGEVGFAEDGVF